MSSKKDCVNDDDIVISGMSGVFPTCQNIKEFEYNLYNKINMVNDEESRWMHSNPNIPKYLGKLPDIKGFDATFFGVHQMQADNMDPQSRMLIEESFKCVIDAGVNPNDLRGRNAGVYIGSSVSESESFIYYDQNIPSGFGITGCSKAMFANRISYTLGLTGPSMLCDTACTSVISALSLAYRAMKNGDIDSAIVGGANICLHPSYSVQFSHLGILSSNDFCCPFNADANGFTRSEAVGCIYLQRKSKAKRVYAILMQCDTNSDGYKIEGIAYPSTEEKEILLKTFYTDLNFDVNELGYLEAHGTGTIAGDPAECKAVDNAICKNRKHSLLIGSVKSNCGHAEPASGIVSIVKAIFTLQNNMIPPNINFKSPKYGIEGLNKGRLRVVIEPTPLPKPYVAINSFAIGGANAHALLRQCEKRKNRLNIAGEASSLPRLVTWSGRSENFVSSFFTDIESRPLDEEYLALVQSSQAGGIQGMVFRGFSIFSSPEGNKENPKSISNQIQHYDGVKRPLIWVFSGMGSQWVGMGKILLQIPLFRQSIQRSQNTLKPSGLNLINIISSDDPLTFENILHSFVGIAAIQIALVDILRELNISPDFIIGHSVGELGCAYADNCMTAEQMILAAYYRGKVSVETDKIKGSMAAVGMSFEDIKSMVPESIQVACHNSSESCTISGPCQDIASFVSVLKSKNIFAREVACSNIAFHSRYISQFGPELLKYLKHILPKPMLRSNKWISTSVPKNQWLRQESKYSSAEYHTNNLLNSVLFEEALRFLPKNAISIEIAPHALLLSILKNAIPKGVHIGLTRRNAEDSALLLLNSLGNLYLNGVEMNIDKLYPTVEWPVSRGTPSLSHMVKFDHKNPCFAFKYKDCLSENGIETVVLKLNNDDQYLLGHGVDGRILVPETFYLQCVWRTFARSIGKPDFEQQSVEFENVSFVRTTTLNVNSINELTITVQNGSGRFEVTQMHCVVASGIIREILENSKPTISETHTESQEQIILQQNDFYKELMLRGYKYSSEFQGIEMAKANGEHAKIRWSKNWVTFMDSMIQLKIFSLDTRNLVLPSRFRFLRIYPQYHLDLVKKETSIDAYISTTHKRIVSGGVEIVALSTSCIQRVKVLTEPLLEKCQFIPHFPAPTMDTINIAKCCIQLVLENQKKPKLDIIDFTAEHDTSLLLGLVQAAQDIPKIYKRFTVCCKSYKNLKKNREHINYCYSDDVGVDCISSNIVIATLKDIKDHLKHPSNVEFILIREKSMEKIDSDFQVNEFVSIINFRSEKETFILLKRPVSIESVKSSIYLPVSIKDKTFSWIKELKELNKNKKDIILISENELENGIIGFVNSLRQEPEWNNIRCVLIDNNRATLFSTDIPLFEKQLRLGLSINILKEGSWGSYRRVLLQENLPTSTRSENVFGSILQIGNLSTIKWLQGSSFSEKNINVVYSSLNFRDLLLASGRLPEDVLNLKRLEQSNLLGFEFSGFNKKTKKPVMGITTSGALHSQLCSQNSLTWDIPKQWSLREAATVPLVYITVYYAFFSVVNINQGKSILIHAGSGGVGTAAIRVALAYGLEVFTTVSSIEKKKFLLDSFPFLKESHIGNSRDTSFENMILEQSDGRGVDFVLNSLSEDKLIASVRCLRQRGHFLEIGQFDMTNNNNLGLRVFLKELSFHAVNVHHLFNTEGSLIEEIKQKINSDISRGIIQPLASTVFQPNEIEQVFRYMGSGKNIGKLLVQIRDDMDSDITLPMQILPRTYFNPSLVYVVPGGLGIFGLEVVDWMVLRGARKVVINSRKGVSSGYQKYRISLWKSYGCDIVVSTFDATMINECAELLNNSVKMGPIGGIFNVETSLKAAHFNNHTTETFSMVIKNKAVAMKNLDELSRKYCSNLKQFVVFLCFSSERKMDGQTNYEMANSIIKRIIEDRVAHGLPGKAIQWDPLGKVELEQLSENNMEREINGTLQETMRSCIAALDTLLASSEAIVSSMIVKKQITTKQSVIDFVLKKLAIHDLNLISLNSTLWELGLDSILSIELKQALEQEYNLSLSPEDLKRLTLERLQELSENCVDSITENIFPDNDFTIALQSFYDDIEKGLPSKSVFININEVTVGDPIIIIPGINGYNRSVWNDLGKSITLPAFVLQFILNPPITNIDDLIHFAYAEISYFLAKTNSKKFQIMAYSFGAMIAHSTIRLLEASGFSGSAIFIDGSPIWVNKFFESILSVLTPDEIEKKLVITTLHSVDPTTSIETIEKDFREKDYREDWWQCVRRILLRNKYGDDFIQRVIKHLETLLLKNRLLHDSLSYKRVDIIESQILLLKPQKPTLVNVDEMFGLKPFTRNTIQIETLEGDHQTILQNTELPNKILKFFK